MNSALAKQLCIAAAVHAAPTVNTTNGPVFTSDVTNGVAAYRSIPFAAPPVGALRFRAPQPVVPWASPRDVSAYPNSCPQLKLDGDLFFGAEDCLYLSVYQPAACTIESPCPVLFWIFGGAWVLGDSSELGWYEATNLAQSNDVVVVSTEYRLGPFGFMALNALMTEDAHNSTGNAALQDQTAALQWTAANIHAFGGDASKVTIFGESAGGFSVCWHLVNQASAGLFHSAIMESGSCDSPQFFQTLDFAVSWNQLYASSVGCNLTVGGFDAPTLACLRSASTEDLMKSMLDFLNPNWPFTGRRALEAAPAEEAADPKHRGPAYYAQFTKNALGSGYNMSGLLTDLFGLKPGAGAPPGLPAMAPIMPWGAAMDGSPAGLLDLPLRLIEAGDFNKVPVLMGTNANEGTIFAPMFPLIAQGTHFPATDADLPAILAQALDMFPPAAVANATELILANYLPYPNDDNWARVSDVVTHMFFTCGSRRTARALTAHSLPVYLYQFSYKISFLDGLLFDLLGDFHTAELWSVWGNEWPPLIGIFSDSDRNLSRAVQGFWTNFATNNNPNVGPAVPAVQWPLYDAVGDANLQLDVPLRVNEHLLSGMCDVWDQVAVILNDGQAAAPQPVTAERRFWKGAPPPYAPAA